MIETLIRIIVTIIPAYLSSGEYTDTLCRMSIKKEIRFLREVCGKMFYTPLGPLKGGIVQPYSDDVYSPFEGG